MEGSTAQVKDEQDFSGWMPFGYIGHIGRVILTVQLEDGQWCWTVYLLGELMARGVTGVGWAHAQQECLEAASRLTPSTADA